MVVYTNLQLGTTVFGLPHASEDDLGSFGRGQSDLFSKVFGSLGIKAATKNVILTRYDHTIYNLILVGIHWESMRIEWDMKPSFYDVDVFKKTGSVYPPNMIFK